MDQSQLLSTQTIVAAEKSALVSRFDLCLDAMTTLVRDLGGVVDPRAIEIAAKAANLACRIHVSRNAIMTYPLPSEEIPGIEKAEMTFVQQIQGINRLPEVILYDNFESERKHELQMFKNEFKDYCADKGS